MGFNEFNKYFFHISNRNDIYVGYLLLNLLDFLEGNGIVVFFNLEDFAL